MILSDAAILEAMKEGNVIIDPFKQVNLKTAQYDVTLGEHFYREQKPASLFFNPYDSTHIKKMWGEPLSARTAREESDGKMDDGNWENIKPQQRVIILRPGENLLCHTEEFIGGRKNITSQMHARSTIGRDLILVCKCAGLGDVGYFNRWTMEITNTSVRETVLIVGTPVAQISFHETARILDLQYAQNGNYQQSQSLEEVRKQWKPEMMLPKALKPPEL